MKSLAPSSSIDARHMPPATERAPPGRSGSPPPATQRVPSAMALPMAVPPSSAVGHLAGPHHVSSIFDPKSATATGPAVGAVPISAPLHATTTMTTATDAVATSSGAHFQTSIAFVSSTRSGRHDSGRNLTAVVSRGSVAPSSSGVHRPRSQQPQQEEGDIFAISIDAAPPSSAAPVAAAAVEQTATTSSAAFGPSSSLLVASASDSTHTRRPSGVMNLIAVPSASETGARHKSFEEMRAVHQPVAGGSLLTVPKPLDRNLSFQKLLALSEEQQGAAPVLSAMHSPFEGSLHAPSEVGAPVVPHMFYGAARSPMSTDMMAGNRGRFGGNDQGGNGTGNELRFDEALRMKNVFDEFDTKRNGSIDAPRIPALLRAMGYNMSVRQCMDLLTQVDINNNGKLEFEEFRTMIRMFKTMAQFRSGDGATMGGRDEADDLAQSTSFARQASLSELRRNDSVMVRTADLLEQMNEEENAADNGEKFWGGACLANALGRLRAFVRRSRLPLTWAWEVVLLVVTTYCLIAATTLWLGPTQLVGWSPETLIVFNTLDVIVTFIVAVDACRTLITPVEVDGVMQSEAGTILAQYVASPRLWVDITALLPWRFMLQQASPTAAVVLGQLRLAYGLRVQRLFIPTKGAMTGAHIRFYFVWAPLFANAQTLIMFFHGATILTMLFISEATHSYITALYVSMYVLAGVGYGDVPPRGYLAEWYLSLLCIAAMAFNGLLIGGIVKYFSESDTETTRRDRLVETQAVLDFFAVPESLQEEILQFQNHTMSRVIGVAFSHIIDSLPEELQRNIAITAVTSLLRVMPLFAHAHASVILPLAQSLIPEIHSPENFVVVAGEYGDAMYFINYGFADVVSHNGLYVDTLRAFKHFGAEVVLDIFLYWHERNEAESNSSNESNGVSNRRRERSEGPEELAYYYSVKSLTYLETLRLSADDLMRVAESHPRLAKSIRTAVEHPIDGRKRFGAPERPQGLLSRIHSMVMHPPSAASANNKNHSTALPQHGASGETAAVERRGSLADTVQNLDTTNDDGVDESAVVELKATVGGSAASQNIGGASTGGAPRSPPHIIEVTAPPSTTPPVSIGGDLGEDVPRVESPPPAAATATNGNTNAPLRITSDVAARTRRKSNGRALSSVSPADRQLGQKQQPSPAQGSMALASSVAEMRRLEEQLYRELDELQSLLLQQTGLGLSAAASSSAAVLNSTTNGGRRSRGASLVRSSAPPIGQPNGAAAVVGVASPVSPKAQTITLAIPVAGTNRSDSDTTKTGGCDTSAAN